MRNIQETGDKGKGAPQDRESQFGGCTDMAELWLVVSVEQYLEMFPFNSSSLLLSILHLASALSLSLRLAPKDSTTVDNNSTGWPHYRLRVWQEKSGQHWALLMTSRDGSAILHNTEGQTQAKATHLHLWLT